MNLQKRLAADILGCSTKKVWVDPLETDEIAQAITKDDIRQMISEGLIKKKQDVGVSRVRARKRQKQRSKGRRRGHGNRKGGTTARAPKKRAWINRIRPQRNFLKRLRDNETITTRTFHTLYKKAKGGFFRSTRHLKGYMEEHGLFREEK